MVGPLLEVRDRGYWEISDENLELLQDIYEEVENHFEGVE